MIKKSQKLMSTMALLLAVFIIPFANANNDPGKIDTRDIPMQTPFLGVNATIPGIIECENYDEGGQGVAFFDKNLKLGLETFRPDDIVDVINKTQASNGLAVFKTRKDEWLEYTVDVTAGTYDITLSYFTNNSNTGALDVSLDGQAVASITGMVAQGGWNTQGTITLSNVDIEQGGTDRILRLFFPNGPKFQIDAIQFELVGGFDECPGGLVVGSSCNDNDNCTVNDVITADCECAGTFQDSDNDGICDADEDPDPDSIITNITLVNSDSNQDIRTIANGDVIVLNSADNVNVRADVNSPVGSIVFNMTSSDGNYQKKESAAPYALFGDMNGNYNPWNPSLITYNLLVTAYSQVGGNGNVLDTKEITFTFDDSDGGPTVLPQSASNLSGEVAGHDNITLSWNDNSDNEDGFRVEFLNNAGNFVSLTTVSSNTSSFTDTASSIGEDRSYRVVSFNTAGLAAPSNTATITNRPDKISGFTATDLGDDDYELSWNTPDFGMTYQIQSSATANSGFTSLAAFPFTGGNNTFDLGSIGTGTMAYRIRIISQGGSEVSEWSNVLTVDNDNDPTGDAVITGDLMEWHKVTLTFDGPNSNELANNNPFMNFKMDVTFTSPNNEVFVVPGYFAADGNAENSLATSGNKWRAHIAPNRVGQWSYSVSFVQGNDVAVNENVSGQSAGFFNGSNGTFNISATNKPANGLDNRGKGRLRYVGEHYLQFEGTGESFIKVGADAPENTLAYIDFDGTTNNSNKIKDWSPHFQDFDANDASEYTWTVNNDIKGEGLLGAINYLSDIGMNAFSFLTWNIEGDDKNVFPQVKINPGNNNNIKWDDDYHKLRMDVSKMAQWEKIFEYGDKKGMFMHFKLMEKENEIFMDRDLLEDGIWIGPERKLYYRELIARFGHHLALNWNLGEECDVYSNVNGDGVGDEDLESVKEWSRYFKSIDPYGHLIVVHSAKFSKDDVYTPLLGNNSNNNGDLTGASLQTFYNQAPGNNAHDDVIEWRNKSANNGRKWVVSNDEQGLFGDGSSGVTPDGGFNGFNNNQDNRKLVRHRALWGALLAGGAGVEYYYGGLGGCSDNTCEDHRSRENKYLDAKKAFDFFEDNLMDNLLDMEPLDELTSDNDSYVFAEEGEIYALYLPDGGNTNLDLGGFPGTYDIQWYNPVSGQYSNSGTLSGGGSARIAAPNNNSDWAAIITKASSRALGQTAFSSSAVNRDFGVFPNPAREMVTIDIDQDGNIETYSLRIMSVVGRVVKELTVQRGQTQINTRDIAPGIYNVMLFDGRTVQSKKLILLK